MRASNAERRTALRQWSLLAIACAASIAGGVALAHRPADAAELAIPVEQLHSDAAELVLLQAEHHAGRIPDGFFHAHLRHLAKAQRATCQDLARLRVLADLEPLKADAVDAGLLLVREISTLRGGRAVARVDLERVRDRLANLARESHR